MARQSRGYNLATNSKFYCTKCGKQGVPIVRKKGQERKSGHLKKIFCLHCQQEVNHVEVKEIGDYSYEDFLEEFELGSFVDGERVAVQDLVECSNTECKYNKNGKCWNANHSCKCGHRVEKEGEL